MIPATPSAEVAVERDDVPARTGGSPTPGPQNAAVKARAEYDRARAASEAATPGGLHGDPAILSGIRRKPNRKADARRFAAYDREAKAAAKLMKAQRDAEIKARAERRAVADAAAPCDLDSLEPGDAIRTRYGWHRVVRVNAKSVTVETGYSWTETVAKGKVIETRKAVTS